jgi:hypothetical protein
MKCEGLLAGKQHTILERWFDLIVETYPDESRQFLENKKGRVDNPVAYEFSQGIREHLDRIISIRAIQDMSPSKAVAFIFLLKTAIRKDLQQGILAKGISEELREIESRIDGLALLCFDIYMKRREKLYEIRVNEAKTRISGLLRMTGLLSDLEKEPFDVG